MEFHVTTNAVIYKELFKNTNFHQIQIRFKRLILYLRRITHILQFNIFLARIQKNNRKAINKSIEIL